MQINATRTLIMSRDVASYVEIVDSNHEWVGYKGLLIHTKESGLMVELIPTEDELEDLPKFTNGDPIDGAMLAVTVSQIKFLNWITWDSELREYVHHIPFPTAPTAD